MSFEFFVNFPAVMNYSINMMSSIFAVSGFILLFAINGILTRSVAMSLMTWKGDKKAGSDHLTCTEGFYAA